MAPRARTVLVLRYYADLNDAETTVTLQQPVQAQYVIIWITQLGEGDGGKFISEIGELTFTAAG